MSNTIERQLDRGEQPRHVVIRKKRHAQANREHCLYSSDILERWRKEYEQRREVAFTEKELTEQDALERFCRHLAWVYSVSKKALR